MPLLVSINTSALSASGGSPLVQNRQHQPLDEHPFGLCHPRDRMEASVNRLAAGRSIIRLDNR